MGTIAPVPDHCPTLQLRRALLCPRSIERAWNCLKNADGSGAGGHTLRWRGLSQVSVYWAAAACAANLKAMRRAQERSLQLIA